MGLIYDFYQAGRRLVFEPLYLAFGYTPKKYQVTAEEAAFIQANRVYWSSCDESGDSIVLVYGHMGGEGVNYLTRLGIVARGVAKSIQGRVLVALPRCQYNSAKLVALFRSFNIQSFTFLREMDWHFCSRFRAFSSAVLWRIRAREVEDLLKISHQGVTFGDLIYNDIIHDVPTLYTISRLGFREFRYVFRFYLHLYVYFELLNNPRIRCLVISHIQYTMFGTLVRLALSKGISVVETTDTTTSVYHREDLATGVDYFSYTRALIQQELEIKASREELIAFAETELAARLEGKLSRIDVQLAYADKEVVSEAQLRERLNLVNDIPIVSVFVHVFSDSPVESTRRSLYRDYYEWLVETLARAAELDDVYWLIKPHPAQSQYGELQRVRDLFAKYSRSSNGSRLKWCPDEISTSGIIFSSHSVVTCQGTIALECSCCGVPAIITGAPFYRGFGFTYEPTTQAGYRELLGRAGALPRLTEQQVADAKAVYGAYARTTSMHENELIDTELLSLVWGYGKKADSNAAFALMAERLGRLSPLNQAIYSRAVDIGRSQVPA